MSSTPGDTPRTPGTAGDHGNHVADDRPYVDGSAVSPAELRREARELSDPEVQRVEEARENLAATIAELRDRLDPRPRLRAAGDRLLAAATRPPVLAGAGGVVLLVVLSRIRRARRADRPSG
jgi:hypothetical protein